MRFLAAAYTPANVAGEDGTRRLMQLIRAWSSQKHAHIQFNILNPQTLLDAQTRDRSFGGSMGARIEVAKEGLAIMRTTPELAFRCGPLAVESILATVRPDAVFDERLPDATSTIRGTSLSQVSRLAGSLGLGMRMAYWPKESQTNAAAEPKFPVPAVVHWRAGHFAALTRIIHEGVN